MSHSHDLPDSLDFDALRTVLDWARGKAPWSQEVAASIYCIVGYAIRQLTPTPRLVGSPADPRPIDTVALDTLEQLASEQQQPVSQGLIPWALLIEWLIAQIINNKLKN